MSKSKYWVFTLNNPSEDEVTKISDSLVKETDYMTWQLEEGKEGTRHIQGYVCFKNRKMMKSIKKIWNDRLHLEVRRGTHDEAKAYCQKDDTRVKGQEFVEYGDDEKVPKKKGQRNDLTDIKDKILAGIRIRDIEDEHFGAFAKYGRYFKAYNDKVKDEKYVNKEKLKYEKAVLRKWQLEAIIKLVAQDDREILWIFDEVGGKGKSWLGRYLEIMKGAFLIQLSKKEDIAYAYDHEEIVIFDLTRSDKEFINYSLIESFKNGRLFSPKYESKVKRFASAKVMILSNHEPDRDKLTHDRLTVVNLENWIF